MKYRPDIDGLRAVAVLGVMLYHAHLGVPGGYAGVDVFFVISGYLIFSILLPQLRNGDLSYWTFWERRVRRLVPALAVVTLFTAITSYLLLLPKDLIDLGGALIAQPLLLSNVYFWRVVHGGYFGDPPENRPLLHTWSLGVEEQFYVFFPLLLLLLWPNAKLRTHVGKSLLCLALGSFFLSILLTPTKNVAAFFNLPTRAWELLVGSLIVFLPIPSRQVRETLSWIGAALIGWAFFAFNSETPFPGAAATIPCLGAALLIWSSSADEKTRVGRFLSHSFLVSIGLASYSLYLWHWPLMAYGDYTESMHTVTSKCLFLLLGVLAGFLSYRCVEAPVKKKFFLRSRRSVLLLLFGYFIFCFSAGALFRTNEGYPDNWKGTLLAKSPLGASRQYLHEHDIKSPNRAFKTLGQLSSPKATFILWGDSHAMALAALLDSLGKDFGLAGIQLTAPASKSPLGYKSDRSITPEDRAARAAWKTEIVETAISTRAEVVFICGYWSTYRSDFLQQDLREAVEALQAVGVSVYIILDNPILEVRQPFRTETLQGRWRYLGGRRTATVSRAQHRALNIEFDTFAKTIPNCAVIALAPEVFSWGSLLRNGQPLYFDQDHLSDFGASQLRNVFSPIFNRHATGSSES